MKKIIISIIVILLIVWIIIFSIDFYNIHNNKEPIFVKINVKYQDGGSYISYGLGYKVIRYSNTSGTHYVYKIGFLNMPFDFGFSDELHNQYNSYVQVNNSI